MSTDSYFDFLEAAKKQESKLVFATVKHKTKSGHGFNLSTLHKRLYLHTGSNSSLDLERKTLLCAYSASEKCKGRWDVSSYVEADSLNTLVDLTWKHGKGKLLLANQFLNDDTLGQIVRKKLVASTPDNETELEHFLADLNTDAKAVVIENIPLERTSVLIKFGLSESRLTQYLLQHYQAVTNQEFEALHAYVKTHDFTRSEYLLHLAKGDVSHVNQSDMIDSIIEGDQSNIKNLIALLTFAIQSSKDHISVLNSLDNHSSLREPLVSTVGEMLPEQPEQISVFLEGLKTNVANEIALKADVQLTPWLLKFGLNEARLIEYLALHFKNLSYRIFGLLNIHAIQNNFLQVAFVLDLISKKDDFPRPNQKTIEGLLDELTRRLFEHHSKNITKIENFIFGNCLVRTSHLPRPHRLIACEAKIWTLQPNQERQEPENKALCRRKNCDYPGCTQSPHATAQTSHTASRSGISFNTNKNAEAPPSSLLLYLVCEHFFGLNADTLHRSDQFSREIAKINRWNEILDRLHCHECQSPLTLAEHAKGSAGKMAYTATFWHCDKPHCSNFCESIKITHCFGCGGVIDSRENKQACNPSEIRSHRKIYICNSCACCCKNHQGFSGRCPSCGIQNAFQNVDEKNRTRAECRNCAFEVSIDKRQFSAMKNPERLRAQYNQPLSEAPSSLVVPNQLLTPSRQGLFIHDWSWSEPILYVYDLTYSLTNNLLQPQQLERYEKVCDLKVIERLTSLGLNHKNYVGESTNTSNVLHILNREPNSPISIHLANELVSWITDRFNEMKNHGLWQHYYDIEHPFILSLTSLLRDGIRFDQSKLASIFSKAERARNVLVHMLSKHGIHTPSKEYLNAYVSEHFLSHEQPAMRRVIETGNYKAYTGRGEVFDLMHKIDKVERIGGLANALENQGSPFKPHYQIVGSDTDRCTTRNPNLLGFPKELRPLISAAPNKAIIECDYSQMEVGVLASLAKDTQLIDDYNTGDVYSALGQSLQLPRDEAKLIFLAILYGVAPSTLSSWLNQSNDYAQNLMNSFVSRYPGVAAYQRSLKESGRNQGYATIITGLKRWINRQYSNQKLTYWEENWLKNFPVQATAAAIFKTAIINLSKNVYKAELKLIAPLYDSIVFEVPQAQVNLYTNIVSASMKRAMTKYCPEIKPKVSVNNHDTSCWNGGPSVMPYDAWLNALIEESKKGSSETNDIHIST